jgi:hypothetical protein
MKLFLHRVLMVFVVMLASHQPAFAGVAISSQQYGSYVILGQSPAGLNIAFARTVIKPNLTCPSVYNTTSKVSKSMITRDNPSHFSVMVCEAVIEFEQNYQLLFADVAVDLPVAKSNVSHIQVFGDTGCKTADCALGLPAEPFKSLADSAITNKPDVVLHMGDFNYRGTGGKVSFSMKDDKDTLTQQTQYTYDAGDGTGKSAHCGQNAPFYSQAADNANRPDTWQYWHDDLFKSAAKLMAAAPWIVVRGNHELCSRAGPGYFYFLDPHSNLVAGQSQLSCPVVDVTQGAMVNTLQVPNYTVSFDTLDVAVIDSANACDSYTNSSYKEVYKKVFGDLNASVNSNKKDTWLITHRPIWAVEQYNAKTGTGCSDDNLFGCINQMMQKAIAAQPSKALAKDIKLVLTGHMHKFESVTFANASHPPNIIVGSSGVQLYGVAPVKPTKVTINGLTANVLTTNEHVIKEDRAYAAFGYLNLKLDGKGGWEGQLVNPPKHLTLANCSSKLNLAQGVCELASGVSLPGQ